MSIALCGLEVYAKIDGVKEGIDIAVMENNSVLFEYL